MIIFGYGFEFWSDQPKPKTSRKIGEHRPYSEKSDQNTLTPSKTSVHRPKQGARHTYLECNFQFLNQRTSIAKILER
jgi:hypothetical protein